MFENIDKKDDSVGKDFYIELSTKLEEMFNKAKTYGEVTLMGDLLSTLNSRTAMVFKDNPCNVNKSMLGLD